MSLFIHLLCTSDNTVGIDEIAHFVEEGAYFDETPEFAPLSERDSKHWEELSIRYHPQKRPIILHRSSGQETPHEVAAECLAALSNSKQQLGAAVVDHIAAARQVISVEVDPLSLPEAGWTMLDCLESFIASRCGGIVYVPGEGLYDQKLKLIANWK